MSIKKNSILSSWIDMDKEKKSLLVFGYGLGVIAGFCGMASCLKHGVLFISMIFFGCSIIFISVTCLDRLSLKPSYHVWMRVSGRISQAVTSLILGVVFIFIFIPVGLFFRLIRKDYLQRKIDLTAKTYWHKRKEGPFGQEHYQRQY